MDPCDIANSHVTLGAADTVTMALNNTPLRPLTVEGTGQNHHQQYYQIACVDTEGLWPPQWVHGYCFSAQSLTYSQATHWLIHSTQGTWTWGKNTGELGGGEKPLPKQRQWHNPIKREATSCSGHLMSCQWVCSSLWRGWAFTSAEEEEEARGSKRKALVSQWSWGQEYPCIDSWPCLAWGEFLTLSVF